EGPAIDIEFVGTIISRLCCSVIPAVPMPIVIPGFRSIFSTRCWALEKFPIEPFGYGGFFLNGDFRTRRCIKSNRLIDLSNGSFVNFTDDFDGFWSGALLVTHLNDFLVFLFRFHQKFPFS